jgi:iron complex outermembrane receptor protein
MPGPALDIDKIAGNVEVLSAPDLSRNGTASLTTALGQQLGSINLNANLDDPFQPDITYRGFEASPVLGTPQGLAVYQDGVRVNEAFGDTVNWDLIPDIAIERVTIVSTSPVYGLNALGAGISIDMKNGFDYQGAEAHLWGGAFERRAADAQYGISTPNVGLYVAAATLHELGWREFSANTLQQLYAVLSARPGPVSLDLHVTTVDNRLQGAGATPVQELAIDRALVFTGPQVNENQLSFLSLNSAFMATPTLSLQALLYYREYGQQVENGNTTDYSECSTPNSALLCQPDGSTLLTNSDGVAVPDLSDGGRLPIGQIDREWIHSYGRGAAAQANDSAVLLGHANAFSAGITLDEAQIDFHSASEVGRLNAQLQVLPSGWLVDTPEGSQFTATPVLLKSLERTSGIYLTDSYSLSSALTLTASARYNDATLELADQRGTLLSGSARYSHLNPAFGVTYKLSGNLTAYAGAAQNARAPTASEIECSNPTQPCLLPSTLSSDPPGLQEVLADTFELGLRGRMRSTPLFWELGVFRTDVHDDIYGVATGLDQGYFQNIGSTRREGLEASLRLDRSHLSGYLSYSYVAATFQSPLMLPSAVNPAQQSGVIQVQPGDRMPGIPLQRLKLGLDALVGAGLRVGAALSLVSNQYFFGDESNSNAPLPGYAVVDLHSSYQFTKSLELFVRADNLLNAHYATYGIYGDPTGINAPGVPAGAAANSPNVDNRFESPAAPFALYAGLAFTL